MHPIIFQLGGLTIYAYGLMLALGVAAGLAAASRLAKQSGLDQEQLLDIAIIAIISGLIGSRLFYVFFYDWDYYSHHLWQIFDFRQVGLVFYGALILGAITVITYIRWKRMKFWKVADIIAPAVALGYTLGRVGCFLNGCCYGKITALPWGVVFPGLGPFARHPTQIYEAVLNLALFIFLYRWFPRRRFDGQVFLIYLIGSALLRFMVEFYRENLVVGFGLTIAQVIALGLIALGVGLYFWLHRWRTE